MAAISTQTPNIQLPVVTPDINCTENPLDVLERNTLRWDGASSTIMRTNGKGTQHDKENVSNANKIMPTITSFTNIGSIDLSSSADEDTQRGEHESDTTREFLISTQNLDLNLCQKSIVDNKLFLADKITLERELLYTKDMLRTQTQRCDEQRLEIENLNKELQKEEIKFQNVTSRLDYHAKLFIDLENKLYQQHRPKSAGSHNNESVKANDQKQPTASIKSTLEEETGSFEVKSNLTSKEKSRPTSATTITPSSNPVINNQSTNDEVQSIQSKDINVEDDKQNATKPNIADPMVNEFTPPAEKLKAVVDDAQNIPEAQQIVTTADVHMTQEGEFIKKILQPPVPKPRNIGKDSKDISDDKQAVVEVILKSLSFEEEPSFWYNSEVELVFMEFSFLGYKGPDTETPNSLPVPNDLSQKINYNFSKSFPIDEFLNKRLAEVAREADEVVFKFVLVSEPEEDSVTDGSRDSSDMCVDVGFGYLTVQDCAGSDVHFVSINNVNDVTEKIATLEVSIKAPMNLFQVKIN